MAPDEKPAAETPVTPPAPEPAKTLVPEDLPADERVEHENDLA